MTIETVEELAETIADWIGVSGCCKNVTDDHDQCQYDETKPICCRNAFVMDLRERIVNAVENDKKLELAGLI